MRQNNGTSNFLWEYHGSNDTVSHCHQGLCVFGCNQVETYSEHLKCSSVEIITFCVYIYIYNLDLRFMASSVRGVFYGFQFCRLDLGPIFG